MKTFYLAVTYDVCAHNQLFEDMNRYALDLSINLDEQIREFAKQDIAPVVRLFTSDNQDFENLKFIKEYTFIEYECNCQE
ncbi:hypothetical protein M3210_07380 [Oceanobacillus luteolus]|uniref:Uncharacterized protein n=1 Tax=Oceanobacillus luteolus TaxID=1274358 RepID=A0ABW4HNF0_9BACI|nr:hypothetical protein [Oceanobacillus luteolus]MCM3740089.1 hypothetical protein [Oceanobacillus luteolus]